MKTHSCHVCFSPLQPSGKILVQYPRHTCPYCNGGLDADGAADEEVDVQVGEKGFSIFDLLTSKYSNKEWSRAVVAGKIRGLVCSVEQMLTVTGNLSPDNNESGISNTIIVKESD